MMVEDDPQESITILDKKFSSLKMSRFKIRFKYNEQDYLICNLTNYYK